MLDGKNGGSKKRTTLTLADKLQSLEGDADARGNVIQSERAIRDLKILSDLHIL